MEERYCSNCRAELPRNADACAACGVYAGDVFDGRLPRRAPGIRWGSIAVLTTAAAAVMLVSWYLLVRDGVAPWRGVEPATAAPPPVRVVGDRPGGARRAAGATVSEAEAMRLARREIAVRSGIAADCLVIMSNGFDARAYTLTAYDRCDEVRLGTWEVDANSGKVARRSR